MTRETRIGLLVALLFIIMFGVVLTGLTGGTGNSTNAPPGSLAMANAPSGDGDKEYGYVPTTPVMGDDRHPAPHSTPPTATRPADGAATSGSGTAGPGSGTVSVALESPSDNVPVAGVTTGVSGPPPASGNAATPPTEASASGGSAQRRDRVGPPPLGAGALS